jgi:hypothetical protein
VLELQITSVDDGEFIPEDQDEDHA